MISQSDLKQLPVPAIRPERIEQASPEMPWTREEMWRRYWTPGRIGMEVRKPQGDAHDAGIFMAIQLWRELMAFDRLRWDKLDGNMLDSYRARLRVGAVCWNEALLRRQSELLGKVRDGIWKPWEDLVREAAERGGYQLTIGQRDHKLDVDPYMAATAYANGWIGQRGEMTWDSLVFDGIMLVECGVLEYAQPVWNDGGPAVRLKDLPSDLRASKARMVPGIRMFEWMMRTGWDAERLSKELGVSKESVSRWRLGHRPHNGVLAGLRVLSGGLITEASFTPRKPPEMRYVENALKRLQDRRDGVKRPRGRPPGSRSRPVGLNLADMHDSLRSSSSAGLVSRFYTAPENLLPGMGDKEDEDEED